MKTKLNINQFTFTFQGRGAYIVTYTTLKTKKSYKKYITDMTLIDKTKNEESPKLKDLDILRYIIKN